MRKYAILAVALFLWPATAFSQCSGQFPAGQICGNSGGSQGLPTASPFTTFFDSLYGTAPGTIIYRGVSGWTSLTGNASGTQFLSENASGVPAWATVSGTGTVTSVALALPNIFTVSGSPITTTGTLTGTLASQTQNLIFASPNGSSGTPTFRAFLLADFPAISANTILSNATSGSAVPTALAVPSCSAATSALTWTTNTGFGCNSITGTGTVTSVATGTGLTGGPITTTGTISFAAIAADNVLANASGGSAAPAAVALTSCSASQNALTYNTTSHTFGCNTISGSGTVLSGTAGQMAWYSSGSTNVVGGNVNSNISAGALTLGTASTTIGQLILASQGGGGVTITPQNTASNTTWTAGTSNGTPVVTASAPLAITTATGNITVTGVAGQVLGGVTPAFTATPTLGASGTTGQVKFAGTTSGLVTFSVNDIAGTWTLKLPASGGSNGQVLTTDGSGNSSWANAAGGGTVSSGTAGQLTYYAASSSTVSGNSNANISAGALTLGTANTTAGLVILDGATSGALTIATQAVAATPTWTAGTSSGTPAVTASAPLGITTATGNVTCATCATTTSGGALSGTAPVAISAGGAVSITGAAGQVLAGAGPAFTATPTLGASGTLGSLAFGNATSGTVTLETVTGALGSVTASLPANTGTIAELNLVQTFTAAQTFTGGTTGAVVINPTATSLDQGLTISQSPSGSSAAAVSLNSITANPDVMAITGGNFGILLNISQAFGGSTVQGGRITTQSYINLTAPTNAANANRNYTATQFTGTASSGDGGTNTGAGAQGGIFGSSSQCSLVSGATNLLGCVGQELDIELQTGSSARLLYGQAITTKGTHAVGATEEAYLAMYAVAGSAKLANGIVFTDANGINASPVKTTGTLIKTIGAYTVANGIDLSSYTITGDAFKSPGITLFGNGNPIATTPPTGTMVYAVAADATGTLFTMDSYGIGTGTTFVGRTARGTAASPTASQSGDVLMAVAARGYGATAFAAAGKANLIYGATENWSDTAQGTSISIATTKNGTTTRTTVFTVDGYGHVQNVGPSSAVPAISACGTSPSAATGSDIGGQVTTGTGGTATCTITFANSFAAAPYCTITDQNGSALTYNITTTAINVTAGSGTSHKLNWQCNGA